MKIHENKTAWQILRINSGRQEHYDFAEKRFVLSVDYSDGRFIAGPEKARALFATVREGYRRTHTVNKPRLYAIY